MKAKRASLTQKERRDMIARQGFACYTFGCDGKPVIGEHFTPVAMGNAQKPDCMLCAECAAIKTRRDIANIAKVKRIRNGKTQYDKRKERGSKLRTRGFDKTKTRGMDGKVRQRDR